MSEHEKAEAAWLEYRDHYQRSRWWLQGDPRRVSRQLRKRDFIAGYLRALGVTYERTKP